MSSPTPNRLDTRSASEGAPWRGVARIVSGPVTLADLRLHRIQLLALREWRATGRELPAELVDEEQASLMLALAAAFLLRRVREAYDGRIAVMKGPDVAAFYPDPVLRPFRDLDLLVDEPLRAQRGLLAAGFHPVGDERLYTDIHHLRPLRWPGIPLALEIHDRPKWLDGRRAPRTAELLEAAVPSRTSVPGIDTLAPEHQAVTLAVHSWAHVPLVRLGHLVDVAAVAATAEQARLEALADEWGVGRVWRSTIAAADGVLGDAALPFSARTWARNIRFVRERTVVESHLQRWLSAFWSEPALPALATFARAVRRDLLPADGEDWSIKRARVAQAIRSPRRRLSEHQETLERRSISGPTFLDRLNRRR